MFFFLQKNFRKWFSPLCLSINVWRFNCLKVCAFNCLWVCLTVIPSVFSFLSQVYKQTIPKWKSEIKLWKKIYKNIYAKKTTNVKIDHICLSYQVKSMRFAINMFECFRLKKLKKQKTHGNTLHFFSNSRTFIKKTRKILIIFS